MPPTLPSTLDGGMPARRTAVASTFPATLTLADGVASSAATGDVSGTHTGVGTVDPDAVVAPRATATAAVRRSDSAVLRSVPSDTPVASCAYAPSGEGYVVSPVDPAQYVATFSQHVHVEPLAKQLCLLLSRRLTSHPLAMLQWTGIAIRHALARFSADCGALLAAAARASVVVNNDEAVLEAAIAIDNRFVDVAREVAGFIAVGLARPVCGERVRDVVETDLVHALAPRALDTLCHATRWARFVDFEIVVGLHCLCCPWQLGYRMRKVPCDPDEDRVGHECVCGFCGVSWRTRRVAIPCVGVRGVTPGPSLVSPPPCQYSGYLF